MGIEAGTVRPQPTGKVRGTWQERTGSQRVDVKIDPQRHDRDTEFRVDLERRWGHQLGDVRTDGFWLNREGAETLRDALTAALEWSPEAED